MYEHFLQWYRGRSLNAYYYSLSYARHRDALEMWKITAQILLKLIPADLRKVPVCLIIDDTLCPKWESTFLM